MDVLKKHIPPKPATQLRRVILQRTEKATKRTDVRHYEDNTALHPITDNTWHKGLFNSAHPRKVKAKHVKHRPSYRIRAPSDAAMVNARKYNRGQGLARFA